MELALDLDAWELETRSVDGAFALTLSRDHAAVLVQAPIRSVLLALAPFAEAGEVVDVTDALARGVGLDDVFLDSYAVLEGGRAVAYAPRGASSVAIIREGGAGSAHDVPLARRLSFELGCPAAALEVDDGDVAFELFHGGRPLESILHVGGELFVAESLFELERDAVARDPYGRVLDVLRAYGMGDDRIAFENFARGDVLLRWDLTIARAIAFERLDPWPRELAEPL